MKNEIKVKIKRVGGYKGDLPRYVSPGSSGLDLTAYIKDQGGEMIIGPGKIELVPTGIAVSIPEGFEGQVRPRSGLALKYGVTLVNTPGTIDSDYRGEIKAILINHGEVPYVIKNGDRISQLVIAKVTRIAWEETEELPDTERGEGGFGSTGD